MSDSINLECVEDGASKFWSGTVKGNVLTTRWGKIGTKGQGKEETFADPVVASASLEKQAAAKVNKGYSAVGDLQLSEESTATTTPNRVVKNPAKRKKLNAWKATKIEPDVLSEIRDNHVAILIRAIKSERAKALDKSLNSISDGVLLISSDIGCLRIADLAYIFYHSKMKSIKEIRSDSWVIFDVIDHEIQSGKDQLAAFMGASSPDEIFQLQDFISTALPACFSFEVTAEFDGFQELRGFFGKAVRGEPLNHEDILSARYMLAPLNYIPAFYYGADSITQGFVFDLQESCFSSGIGWQDYEFTCRGNLWDQMLKSLDVNEWAEALCDVEDFGDEPDVFNALESAFEDARAPLEIWAIGLCLAGYLNFNEFERKIEKSDRYSSGAGSGAEEALVVINSIYPRCVVSLDGNFLPGIVKNDVEKLFEAASKGALAVSKVLRECKSLPKEVFSNSPEHDDQEILKSVVEFALNESRNGRSWLAVGLMFGLWNSVGKEETAWASRIAERLPIGAVPKFVRDVAILHGKTRFDPSIVM